MSVVFRLVFEINKLKIPQISAACIHYSNPNNAGHSKWANIRHIKAAKDGQRAAMFTRLSRQIRLAIQEGGSTNPSVNSALRNVIDIALSKNMPLNTIQNTIKKCEQNKSQLKKHILEIKAFQKVHFICILYAENVTTVKAGLAPIVRKANGSFVDARHLFDDRGVVEAIVNDSVLTDIKTEEKLEEICTEDAIECGAEEIEVVDLSKGLVNFLCNPIEIQRICSELKLKGYKVESAEHVFIPKAYVDVPSNDIQAIDVFINKLKTVEGVEDVYDNINPDVR